MTDRLTTDDALAAVGIGGGSDERRIGALLRGGAIRWPWAAVAGIAVALPTGTLLAVAPAVAAARSAARSTAEDAVLVLLLTAAVVAPIGGLVLTARRGLRRPTLVAAGGLGAAGLAAILLDAVLTVGGALAGLGLGIGAPLAMALLADGVLPTARVRMFGFGFAVAMASPLIGFAAGSDGTLALTIGAAVCLVGATAAAFVPFPVPGATDEMTIRGLVLGEGADLTGPELDVGDLVRRLWARPTVRWALWPVATTGVSLVALPTMLWFLAAQDVADRGAGAAGAALVALAVGAAGIPGSDRRASADPGAGLRQARWWVLAATAIAMIAAVSATPVVAMLAAGAVGGASAVLLARTAAGLAVAIPARARVLAYALVTHALGLGGVLALSVGAGIDRRFGPSWAVAVLAVGFAIGGLVLSTAARHVHDDARRTAGRILDTQRMAARRHAGEHVPLLSCSGIDFSYGQVQVLFDVDFTVDEGEMVALLGTNGAGKSTLLRVISGLGLPSSGSVRFDGRDITFWRPPQRVNAGITQIPGGKAVFGPMSVVENLRVYGYALGRDRGAVDQGIEEALAAFPRLQERRNQPAQVLSGGEQQMLALSKALILEPRLLCIDELSLGLAPKIVADLLQMVRRINERGTAVVLVEQSVNVALQLAQHAYYMEKGEIRFDGKATDLLDRPDILRSVYLQGAAKGLQS